MGRGEAPGPQQFRGLSGGELARQGLFGEGSEHLTDMIERYATAVEIERGLYDDWTALGQPATELGGTTGHVLVEHPLIPAIAKASAAAAKLSEQLGLTGNARKSVGRQIGTLRAPDRVAAGQRPRLRLATDLGPTPPKK